MLATRRPACLALPVLLLAHAALADPLSGSYTIGGTTPDYTNCAEAVADLLAEGVDGPVAFEIRPGTYEPIAPAEPVLEIPQPIVGASSTNRITFRPDAAEGGTVDNVILQVSSGAASIPHGLLVDVVADFIGIEDLSLIFADESVSGTLSRELVRFSFTVGPDEVESIWIVGCRLFGETASGRVHAAVTFTGHNRDTIIRDNVIDGTGVGIVLPPGNSIYWSYSPLVENNVITGLFSPDFDDAGIELGASEGAIIRGNTLDYRAGGSGNWGIYARNPHGIVIDGNRILGPSSGNGYGPSDVFAGIRLHATTDPLQSGDITNNSVTSLRTNLAYGINLTCHNVLVANNSVVNLPRVAPVWSRTGPLFLDGTNCIVMDNVFVELDDLEQFVYAMVIADTTGNTFDANDLYAEHGYVARVGVTDYPSLSDWQATGFGASSVSVLPTFVNRANDLHLAGCSISDPLLRGVPIAGIDSDFDGEPRDSVEPFRGADETSGFTPIYFDPPLPSLAGDDVWLMTAGDLDGDLDTDLAVTNSPFDNGSNDVTLLFNQGDGTFDAPVHLPFANQPNIVKAGHLNQDSFLDLVVSSETADSLLVRFGTGAGAFGPPVLVDGVLGITDIELVNYDADDDTDIIMLVSPGTGPGHVQVRINDGDGTFTWTNTAPTNDFLDDLELGDFDDDGFVDLAIADNTATNSVLILRNLGVSAPGVSLGFAAPVVLSEQVHSTPSASKFMVGDFDGDLDLDLVLGDASSLDSLVILRNHGDGTFASREGIYVHNTHTFRLATALDYEGDGDLDIVTSNNTLDLHLMLNDGTGNFERQYLCHEGAIELGGFPQAMLAASFDGIAGTDLAVLCLTDSVEVLANEVWTSLGIDGPWLVDPSGLAAPTLSLYQNYPNPVRHETSIAFELPRAMHLRLEVFDVAGRRVAKLLDDRAAAGRHIVRMDGRRLVSGVYFYRLTGEGFAEARKMTLLK